MKTLHSVSAGLLGLLLSAHLPPAAGADGPLPEVPPVPALLADVPRELPHVGTAELPHLRPQPPEPGEVPEAVRTPGTDAAAVLSADPGSIVILAATSVPEPSLLAIAAEAARFGIPLALSGLPVLARREEALAAVESAGAPPDGGRERALGPFSIDREALERLGRLLAPTGVTAGASPEVWHAVRDGLEAEPSVPALVVFARDAVEVFPGDRRPSGMLADALASARSAEVRRIVAERLGTRGGAR